MVSDRAKARNRRYGLVARLAEFFARLGEQEQCDWRRRQQRGVRDQRLGSRVKLAQKPPYADCTCRIQVRGIGFTEWLCGPTPVVSPLLRNFVIIARSVIGSTGLCSRR